MCIGLVIGVVIAYVPVYAYDDTHREYTLTSAGILHDQGDAVCQRHARYSAIYREFSQHQSPLVDHVDVFMQVCDTYKYDCYLLPAIAGVETGYGVANEYSRNPFGMADGKALYNDWAESIEKAAQILDRGYFANGLETVDQIGSIYAVDPLWSAKVKQRMADLHEEEEKYGCILPNM